MPRTSALWWNSENELIVFLTEPGDGIEQIDEYRLSEGRYHLVCLHTRRLTVDVPIPIDVAFGELSTG